MPYPKGVWVVRNPVPPLGCALPFGIEDGNAVMGVRREECSGFFTPLICDSKIELY